MLVHLRESVPCLGRELCQQFLSAGIVVIQQWWHARQTSRGPRDAVLLWERPRGYYRGVCSSYAALCLRSCLCFILSYQIFASNYRHSCWLLVVVVVEVVCIVYRRLSHTALVTTHAVADDAASEEECPMAKTKMCEGCIDAKPKETDVTELRVSTRKRKRTCRTTMQVA